MSDMESKEYTDTDKAALAEAGRAGLHSPAGISENHQASPAELQMRVQRLEALVRHIFDTQFRNADVGAIVAAHTASIEAARNPVVLKPNNQL